MLHVQVGHPVHIGNGVLDLVTEHEHLVEVGTEELDGDAGLRTAQHGVDTVTDRLPDFNVRPGDGAQLLTYFFQHLFTRAVTQFEGSFDFRHIHTEGMFVQFGTTGFTSDSLYLGDRKQQLLCLPSDLIAFFERYARQRADIDSERAFVEGWQEAVAQGKEEAQGYEEHGNGRTQDRLAVAQCPLKCDGIILAQPHGNETFLRQSLPLLASEQIAAQHRGQRQCHHGRSDQRHNKGDAQRNQHAPFHTGEEEQGNEADDDNQGRVENRHTYLLRGVEHDVHYRLTFRQRFHLILAQTFPDILHVDNGIIDQRTDGNRHTTERHGVDGHAHPVKHQHRDYQRERQGDQ